MGGVVDGGAEGAGDVEEGEEELEHFGYTRENRGVLF